MNLFLVFICFMLSFVMAALAICGVLRLEEDRRKKNEELSEMRKAIANALATIAIQASLNQAQEKINEALAASNLKLRKEMREYAASVNAALKRAQSNDEELASAFQQLVLRSDEQYLLALPEERLGNA